MFLWSFFLHAMNVFVHKMKPEFPELKKSRDSIEDISVIYKSILYFVGAKWPPVPQLSIAGSLDL